MNKKIYLKDWWLVKPYTKQCKTDSYYLKIANEVKQVFDNTESSILKLELSESEQNLLAVFLCSYFEDIISGTNLWTTFVKKHQELYHKPVPFFEINDYFEGEINVADIAFLIWYFINTIQKTKNYWPKNSFILDTAQCVFNIFDEHYEFAPENIDLKNFYKAPDSHDYYEARLVIDRILFESYLFYIDTGIILDNTTNEIIFNADNINMEEVFLQININRSILTHTQKTKLLALKGSEWLALLLGKQHPLYESYMNLNHKIDAIFYYRGQDHKNIFLEHVSTSKKFDLTKKSFDKLEELGKEGDIIFIGLVNWENEWWFSGSFVKIEYNAVLISDVKKSLQSKMEVNSLESKKNIFDALEIQYNYFLKYNNNSPIAYMRKYEVADFNENFLLYYNKSISETMQSENIEFQKKVKLFSEEDEFKSLKEENSNLPTVVFFNKNLGIEMYYFVNKVFPSPDNPYFEEDINNEEILNMFFNPDVSKELVHFCIRHYKDELDLFKTDNGKLILENLDFFLRFMKNISYNDEPNMLLI